MAPSTEWKEQIGPDEAARFEKLAEVLLGFQKQRALKHPVARGLHAKGQAGAEATFTVLKDLPEHVRVGLGALPGTYRALVRYSIKQNEGRPHADVKDPAREPPQPLVAPKPLAAPQPGATR